MKQIVILALVSLILVSSAYAIDIYGYVQETSGAFLSGTLVELFNSTGFVANTTTNSGGFYNITINLSASGIHVLNYTRVGYTTYSKSVVLLVGQNKEVNTTLGPPLVGTFTGLIFDVNTLSGINGATVLLQGPAVYVATTNGTGHYTSVVAPGTYIINASATGYYDNSATNSVANNQTVVQNIGLTPIGDTTPPNITFMSVSNIGQTSAEVLWSTNENANSLVIYGTSPNSLGSSASNSSLTIMHNVLLTGLSPGTTYYLNVSSADSAGNSAMSGTYSFATQPAPASGGSPSGGGGGGGGSSGGGGGVVSTSGSTSAAGIDFCQSNPYSKTMDSRESLRFTYGGSTNYLAFGRVTNDNATINIIPYGVFTLNEGDSNRVDLDGDQIEDVEITLSSIDSVTVPSQTGGFNFIRYSLGMSIENIGDLQCQQSQSAQQTVQQNNNAQQVVQAVTSGIKNGVLNIIGTITPAQKANPLVGSAITGSIVVAGLALFFILRRKN